MPADVRSIDALRDWQAALKEYREAGQDTLAAVELEIRRSIEWLEEQGRFWAKAVKDAERELWQAKQELNARKLPDFSGREPDTTVQQRAVRRAEAKLEHAEGQVAKCKRWQQQLPKLVDETYRGAAARLGQILDGELAKALAMLDVQLASLQAYANLRPDFKPAPRVE